AGFRCQCPQGRGGSSPPSPTQSSQVRPYAGGANRADFYRTSTGARATKCWWWRLPRPALRLQSPWRASALDPQTRARCIEEGQVELHAASGLLSPSPDPVSCRNDSLVVVAQGVTVQRDREPLGLG